MWLVISSSVVLALLMMMTIIGRIRTSCIRKMYLAWFQESSSSFNARRCIIVPQVVSKETHRLSYLELRQANRLTREEKLNLDL
jgi:hypothetical protein